MVFRQAFFRWLLPAAIVLPLWLLIGWIVFQPGGWALLWVLVIAIPSVLVGELVLTLLVRSRGTVRHSRAVSWWDIAGFGAWHVLTILVGLYDAAWFWEALTAAIVVFIVVFWMSLWQLFRETRPTALLRRTADGVSYIPAPEQQADSPRGPETIVVTENPASRER